VPSPRAYGFLSVEEMDQKGRTQNSNERPRSIEPEESGEQQRDNYIAHGEACDLPNYF
jgi:hypothetical protein